MRHRIKDLICNLYISNPHVPCMNEDHGAQSWKEVQSWSNSFKINHFHVNIIAWLYYLNLIFFSRRSQLKHTVGSTASLKWPSANRKTKKIAEGWSYGKNLRCRSLSWPSAAADRLGKQSKPECAFPLNWQNNLMYFLHLCMQLKNTYFKVIALQLQIIQEFWFEDTIETTQKKAFL